MTIRHKTSHGQHLRVLAAWLDDPGPEGPTGFAAYRQEDWDAWRSIVFAQGLAPHLRRRIATSTVANHVPESARTWIAEQDELNSRRIDVMHADLKAVLSAARDERIAVMPLKGAFITTLPGTDPHRRPMADLDLLVRPRDRQRIGAVVESLGYTAERDDSPRPTHDVFVDADSAGRILSMDGEHPENPRRIEIHVEVKRHLWGWDTSDYLTAALWAGARPGEVLGIACAVPRLADVFAHLAIHASSDLLGGRGRLVQWLDLADAAERVDPGAVRSLPHPRLCYPALRLAARAMPRRMSRIDLEWLEREVPGRLVDWARTVPLDGRCGLQTGSGAARPSSWSARWQRWAPLPWRLSVAYGNLPLPVAFGRHALNVASVWSSRSTA
jgi:hypothetical protein